MGRPLIQVRGWTALVADVAECGWDGGGGRDSGIMALVYSRALLDVMQRTVQHKLQNRQLQHAQSANCDRSENREPQTMQLELLTFNSITIALQNSCLTPTATKRAGNCRVDCRDDAG